MVFMHACPKWMLCYSTTVMHLQYLTKKIKFLYFVCNVCMYVYVCGYTCTIACVKIRGKLWELDLSFQPEDQTQVVRLDNWCLYLLNHACFWPLLSISIFISHSSVFQMIYLLTDNIFFFNSLLQRSHMLLSKTFTWPFQRGIQVFLQFSQQMEHENLTCSQLIGLQECLLQAVLPTTLQS